MTAEIAIINRSGIALAADSAATIGKDRVWKNSNKLFHLAPSADVGVMFFGSGDYCGIPWEILLKQYRKKLGQNTFSKLTEYIDDFLNFLDGLEIPNSTIANINHNYLQMSAISKTKSDIKAKGAVKKRKEFVSISERLIATIEDKPLLIDGYTRNQYRRKHSQQIKLFMSELLDLHVTKAMHSNMITLCYEMARRTVRSGVETGVVFAGYGDDELLPVVVELCVDGSIDKNVRAWKVRNRDINTSSTSGAILPFAQSDIAHLFIEGLMPDYLDFVHNTLDSVLDRKSEELVRDYVPAAEQVVETARQKSANDAMMDEFNKQFSEFRNDAAIQPMLKVVNTLPREEMAAMAEALVEITSLRRKMDSRLETVGGPVDVAIVSKSDGFVWIKRKHYFDIALNRDFIERRSNRYAGREDDP